MSIFSFLLGRAVDFFSRALGRLRMRPRISRPLTDAAAELKGQISELEHAAAHLRELLELLDQAIERRDPNSTGVLVRTIGDKLKRTASAAHPPRRPHPWRD